MPSTSDLVTARPRRRATLAVGTVLLLLGAGAPAGCRRTQDAAGHDSAHAHGTYYCPMHPSYKSDKAGDCPICNMKLVALDAPASSPSAASGAPSIRITPERQQQIGVRFAEAALTPAQVQIRAVGKVTYDETQITHVHTKVSGWIEEVFVDFVGAPVAKGQPLFTLYSPELVSSQEEYLLALRAQAELGASTFGRVAEGARALLQSARRRLELWDVTPAQIAALEARGAVSRTLTMASPVSGVVLERAAYHHGKTVTPDMDLYTLVDLSHVWVQASVYEYEAPFVQVGQAAQITLPYDTARKALRGRVTFISPFVDPTTRTIQVRSEFPNPGQALRPESFVNVVLARDLGRRLVVPKDALLNSGAAQYVFVDKGDGYLEPRVVTGGPEVAGGRVILAGLAAGERVASAANFILDSESQLKGALDALGRPAPTADGR